MFKLSYSKLFAVIIFCYLGIIIYSNSFNNSFHLDDIFSIVTNQNITNPFDLVRIWNIWPTRFIVFLSFSFNYYLNGLNVLGFHLFNLIIHICSSILVWYFVLLTFSTPLMKNNRLSKYSDLLALFSGLIFLSHPIQVESVTYIFQRAASLGGFFYLLSLCLYINSKVTLSNRVGLKIFNLRGWTRSIFYILSWVSCILAMFSKENTITLPLIIVLYEIYFFKKDRINWKNTMPFLITLLIIPIMLLSTKPVTFGDLQRLIDTPIRGGHYFLTQLRVMLTYIRLAFLPINQNIDYDYPIIKTLDNPNLLMSILVLISILNIAIKTFNKHRVMSFSIIWFFITLLPESCIVPLKDVIFEHRLYLPMVGYAILIPSIIFYLLKPRRSPTANLRGWGGFAAIILLLIIIICYSLMTYHRNFIWKDEFSLWNDAVKKSPNKARSYQGRGNGYQNNGYLEEAIADYTKALQINPKLAFTYYDRGNAYSLKDDFDKAIIDYNKAIEIKPDLAEAYNNRADIYAERNEFSKAVSDYTKAVQLKPDLTEVYINRGYAYQLMGDVDSAIADYSRAIGREPALADTYNKRAVAYFLKGDYQKSWEDMIKAEKLGFEIHPEFFEELEKALKKRYK